ncbi:hypothetical protein CDL12_29812 [Handroanthus impetiginosus]|uniref:WAT1-related protein n=1 Tax=Handroanthus impetiginosus TaxID=429701 RepID=A0A2G9FXC7_9LAMI|nr:hypothetical protein CDL12_29812 [Handroanthus impetiginosus]
MALFSKAAISKGMNPYVFVAYRQAFATIALAHFAFFLDRKKAELLSYGLILRIFLISLFGITLSLNLYYFSIREFPGIVKFVASVVSLSGAIVFEFVKGPQVNFMNWNINALHKTNANRTHDLSSTKQKWKQGCLLMLLANTTWASWLVMQAPLVKQYPAKFRLIMLQCLISCMQSSVWAMAMERNLSSWKLEWNLNLFSVAYCGVVVTGLSYWLQVWAVENKGPLYAATFTPLILIFTAIISAFLWKEMLYVGSICGGILLVAGLHCVI